MKSRVLLLIFSFSIAFLAMSDFAMAQIDSRNQTRSDREQNLTDPDKKKKKDRKKKDKNRRLKAKRDARSSARKDRRSSKKKIYSNRKQIRENSRKYRKAREVDRSYQGDITGRKIDRPKNRKREQKRTYEQTDPYQNRRIRTERSRAGPDAPAVRTATKRGERARSGDISGQRIVRQKSRKSAPRTSYPQTNPYIGRKIRTEKERAKSNDRQIESVRSITRSSESKGATYKQRDPYKGRKPKTDQPGETT